MVCVFTRSSSSADTPSSCDALDFGTQRRFQFGHRLALAGWPSSTKLASPRSVPSIAGTGRLRDARCRAPDFSRSARRRAHPAPPPAFPARRARDPSGCRSALAPSTPSTGLGSLAGAFTTDPADTGLQRLAVRLAHRQRLGLHHAVVLLRQAEHIALWSTSPTTTT
jgi:hypothetical protein